ncbi:hypothetical protein ACVHNB_18920 [Streptomyces sp. YJ-C3]
MSVTFLWLAWPVFLLCLPLAIWFCRAVGAQSSPRVGWVMAADIIFLPAVLLVALFAPLGSS